MALDGIFLYALCSELEKDILHGKVDKINQPEKDEVILNIRNGSKSRKLLISASSNYPRVHFTERNKQNPMQPPMFCMLLRKYLIGSKIVKIDQLNADRILIIDFESTDEMGFDSIYSLIIEIMGRHSNISLVRKRDNTVMESIKHLTPDISSYRSLYPGLQYKFPPDTNKLNPFDFSDEEFIERLKEKGDNINEAAFSSLFSGVSTPLSREIYLRLEAATCSINESSNEELLDYIREFFSSIKKQNFEFTLFMDDAENYKDFYCISLTSMKYNKTLAFKDGSSLLDTFYYGKDKQDRLNQKSADLQRLVSNNIDRCYKKEQILKSTLEECKKKNKFQLYGELLTANIYNIKRGDKSAEVSNYYSDKEEFITISLNEQLSPSENVQYYYKRYNKLKKTEEAALEQQKHNEAETEYLQSVITNIRNCDNYNEIEEIRRELLETGYIKFRKTNVKTKTPQSKPLHFKSSEGADIYVGKNNIQNDFLTLKFAEKQDIWMHTKNIPGSHVIIKKNDSFTETTLEEAAILAAYYSKGKDSTKVPVDYTEVKNVKKPSGAKPGMVIYYTNKTIYVDPYDIKLEKI
ncbi:MAG: NFACT RNA binding domain-containing protein [Bacillota bacterium]|nr:NFACT RNA binding domain-containing protein [Bacillota bacterium]